jgi:hypothetical protein
MKKTRGDQLSLRFEASHLGDESNSAQGSTQRHSATVLSLSGFKRESSTKTTRENEQERSLLEKALKRVRLF